MKKKSICCLHAQTLPSCAVTGIRDEAAVMRVINVIAETDLHTHIDMTPPAAATVMLR